jgi:hypothetical protein
LIQGCQEFRLGDLYIANSGEHAIRIGGDGDMATPTTDFVIGSLVAESTGGCGFKVNPAPSVASRGVVGKIVGIDVGEGTSNSNSELVRLTNMDKLNVGSVTSMLKSQTYMKHIVVINGCNNIVIDDIVADLVSGRLITIDETSDGSTRNTSHIYLNRATAQCVGRTAVEIYYTTGGRTLGDVYFLNLDLWGLETYIYENDFATALTGPIVVQATAENSLRQPVGVDALTPIYVDLTFRADPTRRFRGLSTLVAIRGGHWVNTTGVFNPSDTGATYYGEYVSGNTNTSAEGAYGGSYVFTRVGATRRGAAIAAKQQTADQKEVGLDFFVQDAPTTANESLLLAMSLRHTRRVNLPALTAYADNAAALAGGLIAGDVYWTATGEMRRVV